MLITVIIPTYNRYELLKRAIKSLLTQSYCVDEIIVIDDGSSDTTANIQNDFPNIRYFYQENRGVSSARNLGISHSSNEWIAFLDSDDTWHQEKLLTQVELHKRNLALLMSYTAEKWVRNGVEVKIPKKFRKIGKDIFLENISYCNIAPSSVMLHKSLLEKVGLFDETLEVCEDYDLWLRILRTERVGLINQQLITKYAGHDAQLGFRKNMESYRIKILEKLLSSSNARAHEIQKELQQKREHQK